MNDKPVRTLRQVVQIPADMESVYQALTDPVIHSAFTGAKATGEPYAGSVFTAYNGYITGKIIQLRPGKKIILAWKTTAWPGGYGPSRLKFTLSPEGSGTRLVMLQSFVPADQADGYDKGWHEHYWEPLKAYFLKKAVL